MRAELKNGLCKALSQVFIHLSRRRSSFVMCQGKLGSVVVVVRVGESQEAPHAIQNSTKVYVRQGSVTQPYELADIDRIEYLLKRREEPQRIGRRILDRIEERVTNHCSHLDMPNLELIARPVFPYRPIISPTKVYEFMDMTYAYSIRRRGQQLWSAECYGRGLLYGR